MEWKQVPGWEKYEVSRCGKIKGPRGNILKPVKDGNYLAVRMTRTHGEPRRKAASVHRLVASLFCDNPHNFVVVDHVNGDKKDNRASNLRWVSRSENTRNAERCSTARGFTLIQNKDGTLNYRAKYQSFENGRSVQRHRGFKTEAEAVEFYKAKTAEYIAARGEYDKRNQLPSLRQENEQLREELAKYKRKFGEI